MNITDPLRRHARERPDAIAVIRPRGSPLSWREFDRAIDVVARRLLAAGIRAGDIVVLAIVWPYRLLLLELALARIGAAGATPGVPAETVAGTVVDVARDGLPLPRTIVVDGGWFDTPASGADAPPLAPDADGSAVAIVCPSSGTTAAPKHIAISHDRMAARVAAANRGIPLPPAPRQICIPGASSGFGFLSILRVLWSGGTIVTAVTAGEIVAAIDAHRVNRLVMMPFWVDRIVAALPERGGPLASLEQVEFGGACLPSHLRDVAQRRLGGALHSVYGATEGGFIATGPMSALDAEAGEVGRLIDGIELEAVDATGVPLPRGVEGMLRVRGAGFVDAYLADAEASSETFRDGWVRTADQGSVAPDGTVTVAGRVGDMINVGGYKMSPGRVERILLSLDGIDDAAAFGVPDARGITRLCAVVVSRVAVDLAAVDAMFRRMSPILAPSVVMQVGAVPRNEAGKIVRRELVSMVAASGALLAPG